MTDYSAATGTWQIDASHTTLGFAARHAMVAKVRGRFADFDGSFTIDGASPENSTASVNIKTASLDTSRSSQRSPSRQRASSTSVATISSLAAT